MFMTSNTLAFLARHGLVKCVDRILHLELVLERRNDLTLSTQQSLQLLSRDLLVSQDLDKAVANLSP